MIGTMRDARLVCRLARRITVGVRTLGSSPTSTYAQCAFASFADLRYRTGGATTSFTRQYATTSHDQSASSAPPATTLVYKSNVNYIVKRVKLFSFSTSIAAMVLQPLIIAKHWTTLSDSLTQIAVGVSGAFSLGMMLTPLLLHFICKRCVLSMYFDEDTETFTAETYSLFLRPVYTRFTVDEIVDLAAEKSVSIFDFGTIKVRDKVLLFDMDSDSFHNRRAYELLMRKCALSARMEASAQRRKRIDKPILRNAHEMLSTQQAFHHDDTAKKQESRNRAER